MKFTLSWLKEHLETDASLDQIAGRLTAIGLEVEAVSDPAASLGAFTVAQIEQAEQHPNADRLRVCKVNTGSETLQIVCGAPNARAGIRVALARIGSTIPANGMVLKPSKIRDVESQGMLCSSRELDLGDDHAGIMELPESAALGEPIAKALGLNDPVIEIAITPNRGDCLGVRGIARDLAASGLGRLKPLDIPQPPQGKASSVSVSIAPGSGCAHFIGCTIRGVKNSLSPDWMQRRLKAIGLRPISALVDITNYMAIDLGRPLHVYDATKLKGRIAVRTSQAGEAIDALNNKHYDVPAGLPAIADDSGLIGLGGVIGGESTAVDEATQDIFLEVAWFEPARIAEAGRALNILSDARYRFERGVDPAFVKPAACYAVALIQQLCGGEASALIEAGGAQLSARSIAYDPALPERLGGTPIAEDAQRGYLEALGFTGSIQGDAWQLQPPSWRPDIAIAPDVVEEMLRLHGYDHIPATPLPAADGGFAPLSDGQSRRYAVRAMLAQRGLQETVTWSFTGEDDAKHFGGGSDALRLENPISAELGSMRPTPLPNLLQAAARNAARGREDVRLFEIGPAFNGLTEADEQWLAVGLRSAAWDEKNIHGTARQVDLFDAKADMTAALEACGFDIGRLQIGREAPGWYHPGKSGALRLGRNVIGYFGALHPAILKAYDIETPAVAFELFVDAVPYPKRKGTARDALKLSDYQAVERDFAFLLPQDIAAEELLRQVRQADKKLVREVRLFDRYIGKGVPDGQQSLALKVTLQADDRTLTDDEINAVAKAVVSQAENLGAVLRS